MKKIIVLLILGAVAVAFVQDRTSLLVPGKGIEGYVTVGATTSMQMKAKYGSAYKEVKHYSELNGTRSLFSIERTYSAQGISFYFPPNRDTVFCIKVRAPFKAKTDKGVVLGTSTMQDVKDAYGAADFYADDKLMFLEYPGIKFYTAAAETEAEALKQKVSVISIVEFTQ